MSNIDTLLSDYVKIRQDKADTEKELKQIKKEEEEMSTEIINFMEATGGGSRVAPSGHGITKVVTRYPKYKDNEGISTLDIFLEWAERYGNEYVQKVWLLLDMEAEEPEDIFTMQPNTKLVGALLKHYEQVASETNATMEEFLPPGLQQSVKPHLRLTQPKKGVGKEKIGSTDLVEMAKRGAMKKETV